jgi:steroid delta-isomerase
MRARQSWLATLCAVASLAGWPPNAVAAGKNRAAADITATLQAWTRSYNAGDASAACAIFAPDLISTFRGRPDRTRTDICRALAALLADPARHTHYDLAIKEIIVSGNLAVVRLVWTLTLQHAGQTQTSDEPGIDIFRRQADGSWKIARYIAFSTAPD